MKYAASVLFSKAFSGLSSSSMTASGIADMWRRSATFQRMPGVAGIMKWGLAVLCLVWPFTAGAAPEQFVITTGGRPAATIVIAEDVPPSVKLAAEELQEYIERMSGATLPVVNDTEPVEGARILVGNNRHTAAMELDVPSGFSRELKEEGFLIKTLGNDLILIGNDTGPRSSHKFISEQEYIYTGSLFAVYELLERLGCRWYYPGPLGEVVPQMADLSVEAMNESIRPSFPVRGFWYGAARPRRDDPEFNGMMNRWMVRNRFLPYGSVLSSARDGSIMSPFRKLVWREVDGERTRVNEMFEEHPEYFAMRRDGTRSPHYLCLANPDVLRIATEQALQHFRDNPDSNCFGYAPPDGAPTCECDECRMHNYNFMQKEPANPEIQDISEGFYRFLNQVAEGVKKEFPDKWITSTAYSGRIRPPTATELGENISLHLAFLGYAQHHRLDFEGWMTREKAALLERWASVNPYMVERQYYPVMQFTCHIALPMHRAHAFNVRKLKEWGMAGAEWEGRAAFKTGLLNYYVLGRMLWDADTDIDALLDEHYRLFYGNAAAPVADFVDAVEELLTNAQIEFHEEERLHEIYPYDRVVEITDAVGDIEALVADADDLTRQRVRFARLVVDHLRAYVEMRRAEADLDFGTAAAQAERMIDMEKELDVMNPTLVDSYLDFMDSRPIYGELGANATAHGKLKQYLAKQEMIEGPRGDLLAALPVAWDFKTDPDNEGLITGWFEPKQAPMAWDVIETTRCWEGQGYQDENLRGYDGIAWYRTRFTVPKEFEGREIVLFVGGLNNQGWFWVNGEIAGHQPYHAFWRRWLYHHEVDITEQVSFGSENELVVRVKNDFNFGGIFRRSFVYAPRAGYAGADVEE